MAEAVRKRSSYDPYRNISYAYDGAAARVLEPEVAQPRPRTRTHTRPRQEELTRPQVATREAGKVSLFAVGGFAAVAALAVCILLSYVQISSISHEMVQLNNDLVTLRSEEATLRARYELAYDLGAIENAVTADGSMSRPQAGQIIYVDMTEPDSVVLYSSASESPAGFLDTLEEAIANALAYFRGEGA